MKHNRELRTYQKMLELIFELNSQNSGNNPKAISIPISLFLSKFNKYWNKYFARQFRK